MSYKIVFKGNDIEDIIVDNDRGMSLAAKWQNNELPSKVNIDGFVVESSAIKAIISGARDPHKSDSKSRMAEMLDQTDREHATYKKKLLALSPEERGKRTAMAEYVYFVYTGKEMPEELKPEFIKAQQEYFKENPEYAEANPVCYKHLINEFRPDQSTHHTQHISTPLVEAAMTTIEQQITMSRKTVV